MRSARACGVSTAFMRTDTSVVEGKVDVEEEERKACREARAVGFEDSVTLSSRS